MSDIPLLLAERPHLFSSATVALAAEDMRSMAQVVAAVEKVVALPAWRSRVLGEAAPVASAGRGVFFAYDFHETPAGPKLIEINTNAGGGLLCAWRFGDEAAQDAFVDMFRDECPGPLRALAIVDETPATQYLYPEFLLFQQLFARHGVRAVICAPEALSLDEGGLWCGDLRLDLVYNRLTDFALQAPACATLRRAWLEGAAVVTPHPRAYALYADKRNLILLSDDELLSAWGVDGATRAVLAAGVPATEPVSAAGADDLWARRRQLFFKPARGYGSKAAYRGDKLTKGVFAEILAGEYVAQALVPPSTREVVVGDEILSLKLDIRNYVYGGRVQMVAARLWQGQTTNFRTPGGGFAKVEVAG